jgi:tRNA (mo5U34)-methyltransferase
VAWWGGEGLSHKEQTMRFKSLVKSAFNGLGYDIHRQGSDAGEHGKPGLTADERVKQAVAAQFWWHTISLPGDIKTPGKVPESTQDWIAQLIPSHLSGRSVLDVGAWDGYYSFLAERRGAASVLAIDNDQNGRHSGAFITARKLLHSGVEYAVMDVENIEQMHRHFDTVFFFGVYYHLKNPLSVLEALARVTERVLLLEGHFIEDDGQPMMRFYPGAELAGDPTNWWGANEACLVQMLKASGFARVEVVAKSGLAPGLDARNPAEVGGRILIRAYKQQ